MQPPSSSLGLYSKEADSLFPRKTDHLKRGSSPLSSGNWRELGSVGEGALCSYRADRNLTGGESTRVSKRGCLLSNVRHGKISLRREEGKILPGSNVGAPATRELKILRQREEKCGEKREKTAAARGLMVGVRHQKIFTRKATFA